ncbi:MAG TPA: orotidine-5'-phosphate decarboxylase [Pyrinomonadaceae bacterium]|nr:orotidine-5'-phosphate decarboxylase [Pyrinomonadaceae bacterium]
MPTKAADSAASIRERIIVALDVDSAEKAREITRELAGHVGAFKVGLQLFTSAGPGFVTELTADGHRIFLDLKFHDIPNTVAKASVEAARLGVWMFNVHAAGGSEMMKFAVEEVDKVCAAERIERPLMIAVTVLTSSNAETLSETGFSGEVDEQVVRLARLAESAGMDGVVASPREVTAIRAAITRASFLTVTPGIRPENATIDDQKRVTTLRQALAGGSDYAVIGRPITQAADRVAAVEQIVAECVAN